MRNQRWFVVLAIILITFCVISFAIPFGKNAVFWIAFAFGIVAILFQLYVLNAAFSNGKEAKSKYYGFPIARIGVWYLVLQLLLSIVEMLFASFIPVWGILVINVIVVAVALVGCIAAEAARDEIVRQDNDLKSSVAVLRSLQSITASIVKKCSDDYLKKELQALADEFRYSDPVSSAATVNIENELTTKIKDLERSLDNKSTEEIKVLISDIHDCLTERNRVCVLNKQR